MNDREAPPHYRARYDTKHVSVNAERLDVELAFRGAYAVFVYLVVEIGSKAARLGRGVPPQEGGALKLLPGDADRILEDCFKIRQACRKIEALLETPEED